MAVVNLTILRERAIVTASLPRGQPDVAKQRVEDAGEVLRVLGPAGRCVILDDLQALQLSNEKAEITYGYLDGKRRASYTAQHCQPFQKEIFAAVREKVGEGWHERTKPLLLKQAIELPFWIGALVLLFGVAGLFAVRQQETARKQMFGRPPVEEVASSLGDFSLACLGTTVALLVAIGAWAASSAMYRATNDILLTRNGGDEGEE